MLPDYDDLDATAMADLVHRGDVHPRELVEAAIERTEARNPSLNAIIHRQFERARADAEHVDTTAPFAGVPFVFKDYKGREAGEPYHAGVGTLRDLDYRPRTDSRLALRVRAGGLIPIGRTNVARAGGDGHDRATVLRSDAQPLGSRPFAWRLVGWFGSGGGGAHRAGRARHRHLWLDPHPVVVVRAGRPEAHTRARVVVSADDTPIGMDAEGVVTRSVRDTAALVDLLTWRSPWWPAPPLRRPLTDEVDSGIGPLRVGVWTKAFNGAPVDSASAAAATDAADLLASMGCSVDVSAPAVLSSDELWEAAKTAMAIAAATDAAGWKERIGHALGEADLEPRTWGMVQAGQAISAPEAMALIEQMQRLAGAAFEWFEEYDLLVTPTTAGPATPLGDYITNYVSGLGSAFARARSTSPASQPSRCRSAGQTTDSHAAYKSWPRTGARTC